MRFPILFSTALLLLLLGCAGVTEPAPRSEASRRLDLQDGISLAVQEPRYSRGEVARFALKNGTDGAIGYNLCSSAHEVRVEGSWRRLHPLRFCTAVLYTLQPGAQAVHEEPIDQGWQPGTHRLVTTVEVLGSGTRGEVFSDPFSVR